MNEIKSLTGLINSLKHSNAEDYVKLAKNMIIPLSDFDKYLLWKKDGYSRNCIIRTEAFELILFCWNKDDFTPIHRHDNQKCWIYQVNGEMVEIRYEQNAERKLIESNKQLLTPGSLTYMHDNMGCHMLKNLSEEKAITLHLYIKPLQSCKVFNYSTNCFEKLTLDFDTIDGEIVNN